MYYSVTFTNSEGDKKNTWEDWHLVPTSPPSIEPPEPYTNLVDIPGRAAGPIDLSETLAGRVTYQSSKGQWSFLALDGYFSRPVLYQMIRKFLHGQRVKVEIEEDPLHYYTGRMSISQVQTGKGMNGITIKYVIDPLRYNLDGTVDD